MGTPSKTRSDSIKRTIARKMAEGTWYIPERTPEQERKRSATMRANALGKTNLRKCGTKTYRQVMTLDGYRYEHRVVMERLLGRKLERWEHVHHINEDGLDNRPENLEVLTVQEHTSHHMTGRPKSPEQRAKMSANNGRRRKPGQWARDHDRCIACGTTERPHQGHGLCGTCRSRRYRLARAS